MTEAAGTGQMMPATVLETERLMLRAFTESDIDEVHVGMADPLTRQWLPIPEPGQPYTRADAERWCLSLAPRARVSGDGQQWAAIDRRSGRFAGSFGLVRTVWSTMTTEVGYWVAPWARGHGIASEAVAAVSRWAVFEQRFQRVELKAAVGNTASRRVAQKTGFTLEGIERNAMPLHEGRTDLAVYSLVPGDPALSPMDGADDGVGAPSTGER